MQPKQNTPTEWESLISSLATKADTFDREATELAHEREGLILDAEMGVGGAAKRLKELDEKIAASRREAAVKREAILQAQSRLAVARAEEAATMERARQAQMSALTASVLGHAEEFTVSLRKASTAASAMKSVIRDMLARADPQERQQIDQMFSPGHWLRAAQNAGLREHIELPPYTGLAQHVVPIETIAAIHLGKWIEKEE